MPGVQDIPRSSSGDETRVIRSTYGANQVYFDMNVRGLELHPFDPEVVNLFGLQLT